MTSYNLTGIVILMSKRKIKAPKEIDQGKLRRRAAWERGLAETRDGVRNRASTIPDARKKASKNACRKGKHGGWND